MINIKNIDSNKIKIDVKSYENILSNAKVNSKNPLYFIINKINGYTEQSNEYLTLVVIDKSKDTLAKYEELWSKIRYLIMYNNSDDYDEKYMTIKFN